VLRNFPTRVLHCIDLAPQCVGITVQQLEEASFADQKAVQPQKFQARPGQVKSRNIFQSGAYQSSGCESPCQVPVFKTPASKGANPKPQILQIRGTKQEFS
jgi:hypothetical protein